MPLPAPVTACSFCCRSFSHGRVLHCQPIGREYRLHMASNYAAIRLIDNGIGNAVVAASPSRDGEWIESEAEALIGNLSIEAYSDACRKERQ